MSEGNRLGLLFFLTVGFCSLVMYKCISEAECLVGAIGTFVIAMFQIHLWCVEKEKRKSEENISNR